MPISSLVIRTDVNKTTQVVKNLEMLKDAEILQVERENVVVITETENQSRDKELWSQMESIPGVLKCDLIYHNFEDQEGFEND
ncbi:MAG: chaperone NapD [Candidatus Omnitrophica bacterium]|nr:chaperone NapD [Candidatus Omnitrophota bacterium]